MAKMYDSAEGTIPALPDGGAGVDLLVPTDGQWHANGQKMAAANPNSRVHTISEVGQVVAEWIDCEPGCVWPPQNAVDLYHAWVSQGCRGFYSSLSTQPTLRQLLAPGDTPEWFDADPGPDKVDAGDVATQYEFAGGYDVSETTPVFEGQPTVPPVPTPQEPDMIAEIWHDNTNQYIVWANGTKTKVPDPASGSALVANPAFTYRQVPTELLAAIPGG